jgi:hypothetical protein
MVSKDNSSFSESSSVCGSSLLTLLATDEDDDEDCRDRLSFPALPFLFFLGNGLF